MTRIHDMGGRFGDSKIAKPAADEPTFKEDWQARALATTLATGALGMWNIDQSRHAREKLPPATYARSSYYEKWLCALADLLVENRLVSIVELANPEQTEQSLLQPRALRQRRAAAVLGTSIQYIRESASPRLFAEGDQIRTRSHNGNRFVAGGHTRLPEYVRGRMGHIVACRGAHVFPDSNAHSLGESPEWLYSVEFTASELWGPMAESANDTVLLDLWESYLEPV